MNTLNSSAAAEAAGTDFPPASFALLYLDDLTIAEFATRKEREIAKARCFRELRPFISLRYGSRISGRVSRNIWMPQETHYLSNL